MYEISHVSAVLPSTALYPLQVIAVPFDFPMRNLPLQYTRCSVVVSYVGSLVVVQHFESVLP